MFLGTLTTTENKPRGITLHWVDPLAFCMYSVGTKLWCFDCMYVLYPPVRTTFEVPSEIIHFLAHICFKGNHQNQIKSPKMTCWMWVRIQILSIRCSGKVWKAHRGKNPQFIRKFTFWKSHFLTKFTSLKSHFSPNSHLQSLIFHKIHIFQTSN